MLLWDLLSCGFRVLVAVVEGGWFGLLLWFGYILVFAGFLILMWGWYNIHYCVFAALAFCGFGVRVIRAGLV